MNQHVFAHIRQECFYDTDVNAQEQAIYQQHKNYLNLVIHAPHNSTEKHTIVVVCLNVYCNYNVGYVSGNATTQLWPCHTNCTNASELLRISSRKLLNDPAGDNGHAWLTICVNLYISLFMNRRCVHIYPRGSRVEYSVFVYFCDAILCKLHDANSSMKILEM